MIKKEIRRAKQRKDWDTVQKLENILKTQDERRKMRLEMEKIQFEITKGKHDMKTSFRNLILGVLGALISAIGLALKSYFEKK